MSDSVEWQNLQTGELKIKYQEMKRAHPVNRHQYKKKGKTKQ